MAKFLQLRNGVPYSIDVSGIGSVYDESVLLVGDTTLFTLPLGQTYTPGNNELEIEVDGIGQESGVDYTETNSTQVTFSPTLRTGQRVRVRRE